MNRTTARPSTLPETFPVDLFWSRVAKGEGCWVWIGSMRDNGYGRFSHKGVTYLAHRLAWYLVHAEIDVLLPMDHLCRNRSCVNPAHLEQVTDAENTRRGNAPSALNALKTHCPVGHEYTAQNTRVSNGKRNCRLCQRRFSLAHYHRRAAALRGST